MCAWSSRILYVIRRPQKPQRLLNALLKCSTNQEKKPRLNSIYKCLGSSENEKTGIKRNAEEKNVTQFVFAKALMCCKSPQSRRGNGPDPWKHLCQFIIFSSLGIKVTVQARVIQESENFILFSPKVTFTLRSQVRWCFSLFCQVLAWRNYWRTEHT